MLLSLISFFLLFLVLVHFEQDDHQRISNNAPYDSGRVSSRTIIRCSRGQ